MANTSILTDGKVLYTARTYTTGGRDGSSRSDDDRLNVKLSSPGSRGEGTNPEQLFAAGWSACFEGAMAVAARNRGVTLPANLAIATEVDLRRGEMGYSLAARMKIDMPGIDRQSARSLIDEAHELCPYSKATRGNIPVDISLG
ncbi:MAG: organic hydroperoxide resistance protein [Allosphingosinicella sp.]